MLGGAWLPFFIIRAELCPEVDRNASETERTSVPNLLFLGGFLMLRFIAGAAAAFLLLTGAFLLWQSKAAEPASALPNAPAARPAGSTRFMGSATPFEPVQATTANREERRFSRADKNKDGRIEAEEVLGPRRKAFAKLDVNGNGALSFEEWAAKTIDKFRGADADRTGWLTAAEYATTAPPPPKHKPSCRC